MGKRRRLRPVEVLVVIGIFFGIVAVFIGLVAGLGKRRAPVSFEGDYYFLMEECEDSTAAAIAGHVYSSGGAGYLLHRGDAVVVACYYTVQDAERVQSAMREKGMETRIAEFSAKPFSLNGSCAAFAEAVTKNAETVDVCARLLYDVANGLERAERGQAEARAAARGVASSLAGLVSGNTDRFFDCWNAELVSAARQCKEIAEGIVFAKELRRVQAQLLCALVELHEYF